MGRGEGGGGASTSWLPMCWYCVQQMPGHRSLYLCVAVLVFVVEMYGAEANAT